MSDEVWKVLIIDDDEGIHSITKMVFRTHEFEHRPIQLIHAFSAREAYNILQKQPDIAVILLDVVMETDDAGLNLVNIIRHELHQSDVRIILRTGHPGFAPQSEVIMQYDINDYLSKAELSASRLTTAVLVAIRSYRDIKNSKLKATHDSSIITNQAITEHHTVDEQSLIAEVALHLDKTLERIQQESSKLQQFNHKPMVDDVVESLVQNTNRLSALNLLLKPALKEQASHIKLTTELDEVVRMYAEQAKLEDWIIDYQIDQNSPQMLMLDPTWLRSSFIALIELAISKKAGNSIMIDIKSEQQRIYISVQDDINSKNHTLLQLHIIERLQLLAQQYNAKLNLTEDKPISFSFAITL